MAAKKKSAKRAGKKAVAKKPAAKKQAAPRKPPRAQVEADSIVFDRERGELHLAGDSIVATGVSMAGDAPARPPAPDPAPSAPEHGSAVERPGLIPEPGA
jgi:hypothetical protein